MYLLYTYLYIFLYTFYNEILVLVPLEIVGKNIEKKMKGYFNKKNYAIQSKEFINSLTYKKFNKKKKK